MRSLMVLHCGHGIWVGHRNVKGAYSLCLCECSVWPWLAAPQCSGPRLVSCHLLIFAKGREPRQGLRVALATIAKLNWKRRGASPGRVYKAPLLGSDLPQLSSLSPLSPAHLPHSSNTAITSPIAVGTPTHVESMWSHDRNHHTALCVQRETDKLHTLQAMHAGKCSRPRGAVVTIANLLTATDRT